VKPWDSETIVEAFAKAAVDPSRWVEAMDTIAKETGSFGAILFPVEGGLPSAPISESMQPGMEVYFRDGWHLRDDRQRTVPTIVRFGVADDFDCTTPEGMKRHPYYQELLRPLGLQYYAGVKMAADSDLWVVSIQRSLQQGPFSAHEKRELAALSSRISSAAALARALGFAASNAAVEAFEISGRAIALLNRRGEVVRLNRAAEALFNNGLRIIDRRITSHDHAATAALDRALHQLLWIGAPSGLTPPVVLPRGEHRPILAYPVKLQSISRNVFADCQVLLVLVDLEQRSRPSEAMLQTAFGLTPAEARLAARLATGEAIEAASGALHISKETARHQLKSIFDKTGVHRQPELIALMLSLLGQAAGG
jgi:DNA-binding CsgD family transcriptional regulator